MLNKEKLIHAFKCACIMLGMFVVVGGLIALGGYNMPRHPIICTIYFVILAMSFVTGLFYYTET